MILNINSPSYYTQKFGIDEDLYALSRQLSKAVQKKEYSDVINTIGIVPIIAPKDILDEGNWKEKVYIKNIIDSIKAVGKKLKKDLRAEEMINDIINYIDFNI